MTVSTGGEPATPQHAHKRGRADHNDQPIAKNRRIESPSAPDAATAASPTISTTLEIDNDQTLPPTPPLETQSAATSERTVTNCDICSQVFTNMKCYELHVASKKHAKRVRLLNVSDLMNCL